MTTKNIRLISILTMATNILGKTEAKNWVSRDVPSLGNQAPLNLLETEAGYRLVEQTLLQIKHNLYG